MKLKITKKNVKAALKNYKKKERKITSRKEDMEMNEFGLNLRQEQFCQLYATDREFFGNGVESYIEAYDPDLSKPNWYKTCAAAASRLLKNVKVFTRINSLLNDDGFNDANADKQLLFIMNQHADIGNKLGSIREYNKLKKRISDKMIVVDGGFLTELAKKAEEDGKE